jgi:uncharacterized protein (DUF488 family)
VTTPFFTVGHSNRSLEAFAQLLSGPGVEKVVDIRTVPRSRTNPQFDIETLPLALEAFGVAYEHMPALGGLRGKSKTVPPELNGFWENASFHNYADYALSAEFAGGLERLRAIGRERPSAFMCSEAVWWRCHRRIVADWLMASGETVFHIMGEGRLEPARLTPAAAVGPDGKVVYPRTPL